VAQFIGRVNALSGQIVRADGQAGEVWLWGRAVPVRLDGTWHTGERVTILLRPESVDLGLDPDRGWAQGTIRAQTFLGEKVEYLVEVEGSLIQAVVYDSIRHGLLDVGMAVAVDCEPTTLRLLRPSASSQS